MKATELRIGNWIFEGYERQWEGVDYTCYKYDYNYELSDEIEPIELTDDWLIDFGFENKSFNTTYLFVLRDFMIGGYEKTFGLTYYSEDGLAIYGHEIKYVHQLQNLYFALTGQELKVN